MSSRNATVSLVVGLAGVKLNVAFSGPVTLIVFEAVDVEPLPVTVSVTTYEPAEANMCDGVAPVAAVPSPKVHERVVTVPVELSMKVKLVTAAVPVRAGLTVNAATGGCGVELIVMVTVLDGVESPCAFVATT